MILTGGIELTQTPMVKQEMADTTYHHANSTAHQSQIYSNLKTFEHASLHNKARLTLENDKDGMSSAIGKRVHRSLNDACDGDLSSAYD